MKTLVALLVVLQGVSVSNSRLFGCEGPFAGDLTEQRLIDVFGAANVRPDEIYVGEGFTESGAIVFPDSPAERIEIVWADADKRASPRFVRVARREGPRA